MTRLCLWLLSLLSIAIVVAFCLSLLGFTLNPSDSIPKGVYRITHSTTLKGKYVLFCPDNRKAFIEANNRGYISRGFCPSGLGYMMKKVVAISGDIISVTDEGVIVNNKRLPYSTPLLKDGADRALGHWRIKGYKLKDNELLTMTDQDKWSFDGRYYGLIKTAQVKGVLLPVWIKPINAG